MKNMSGFSKHSLSASLGLKFDGILKKTDQTGYIHKFSIAIFSLSANIYVIKP
jgi:hypothetical protein